MTSGPNFSISPDFSHNEWKIKSIEVSHTDNEYKCCPGDLWPNSIYSIKLKRNFNLKGLPVKILFKKTHNPYEKN